MTRFQVEILPFKPENQGVVKDLILAGLGEHWGFIDPTKNPDLNHIAASYQDEIFLVAWKNDEIIGTGALIRRSHGTAEVVRMSVANQYRRQGIGRQILECLIEKARSLGYNQIILETTQTWKDVMAFYLSFGFRITHSQDGDVYFALDLEH
jgi:putative acetyltransferase